MFNFALKNLWTRKSKAFLSALSIIMATTIGLLAFNISKQVEDGIVQTGYPPHEVTEVLSLLKMDFLGLRNLTMIYKTVDLVKKHQGINPEQALCSGHRSLPYPTFWQWFWEFGYFQRFVR